MFALYVEMCTGWFITMCAECVWEESSNKGSRRLLRGFEYVNMCVCVCVCAIKRV